VPKKAPESAGRKKLAALGIQLPLFPTMAAHNLPKSLDLVELRYKVARGLQMGPELDRKERLAAEIWIRQQERLNMDVLVDGEMSRSDMIAHFARKIGGFEPGGIVRVYGNRYYRRPIIKGKLEWKGPVVADVWKFCQRMTHRPVKAVLTGPATLVEWSYNDHYATAEEALKDAIAVLRRELTALAESGARIVQIEEHALSSRPADFDRIAAAIKELTAGFRFYFILHHAYGNLTPVWDRMQSLPVDQFSVEAANSNLSLLPTIKKSGTKKDVAIGLVDSHSRVVETPAVVRERLKKALAAVPPAQLWLTSDSGLRTRTPDEAVGKLKAVVTAAVKQRAA
jgi:5-methyltetrahydropteroyltriglutamate--homocysteine methyltransferase